MKINLKSEKGAITLVVLIGMLFLTAFLMSMYVGIANKAQSSAETTKQIQEKYNNLDEAETIYNNYFADTEVIPIYTREQLEKIASGEQVLIKNKVYTFSTDGYYTLQNDLNLGGVYDEDTGAWSGEEWTPLTDEFTGTLDGLGHTITGLYINNTTASNQGLYGTLNGTVKNLSLQDSYINADNYVGSIAGQIGTTGVIQNCYNTSTIIGNTNVTGGYFKSIETGELIYVWNDNVLVENAYFVSGSYTATAPKGFKVSKNVLEQTIEEGMVIQDENGNEFVWVPVSKPIVTKVEIAQIKAEDSTIETDLAAVQRMADNGIYPMAVEVTETDGDGNTVTNYKGVLYSFSGTDTLTATVYDWTSTTSYREPANLNGTTTFSAGTTVNGTTFDVDTKYKYDSQEMFTLYGGGTYTDTLYQSSYNKMVQSVANNDGFYVGRYEISNNDGLEYVESKKGKTALADITWYEMYKLEKAYAEKNTSLGVTSEMIWGSQWDQMMIFVNGKDDGKSTTESPSKFYVAVTGNRKSGSSLTKTGMNTNGDEVANVFDLEAGRYEWIQEAYSNYLRGHRGR